MPCETVHNNTSAVVLRGRMLMDNFKMKELACHAEEMLIFLPSS
jgi:hypothetical protein